MFRDVMLLVTVLGGVGIFVLFAWITIKDVENSDRMARETRARREARARREQDRDDGE
jgi:hypothetical protein